MTHHLLIVAVILILAVAGYRLLRHFDSPAPKPEAVPVPSPQVDVALQQVRYTETRDGERLWTLVADQVSLERAIDLSRIEGVQLTFYGEQGQEEVQLHAAHGSVRLAAHEVEVWGDVRARTRDGMEIRTERLRYQQANASLTADGPVTVDHAGVRLQGTGFIYKVPAQTLTIASQARATIWPDTIRLREN